MAKSLERRPSAMWNLRRGGVLSAWVGNNRLSPWRFRHAVLSNLERWESFASLHTFDSIVKELEDVGLDSLISVSAENYLRNLSVSPHFQSDPYSRVRELASHRTWPMFVDSPP